MAAPPPTSKPLLQRPNSVSAKKIKRKTTKKKIWCDDLAVNSAVLSHTTNSAVKWRQSQFQKPEETYNYRCRVQPKVPSSDTPPSATAVSSTSRSKSSSRRLDRSVSSVSLVSSNSIGRASSSGQQRPRSAGGLLRQRPKSAAGSSNTRTRRQAWSTASTSTTPTSQLSLTVKAVAMQPRPSSRSPPSTPHESSSESASFPYPDPMDINGDSSFEDRLAELAQLECDSIKYEEAMRRYSAPNITRPISAKNTLTATSKQKTQSTQRGSKGTKEQRPQSSTSNSRSHRVSLPTAVYKNTKVSVSITKKNVIKTEKSVAPSVDRHTKDFKEATDSCSTMQKQSSEIPTKLSTDEELQPSSTPDVGEDMELSGLSCSPPIVYVSSLPNYKQNTKNMSGGGDSVAENAPISLKQHTPIIDVPIAWEDNPTTDSSSQVAMHAEEDELQVTSDLGLSIESLHLTDDENITSDKLMANTEREADKQSECDSQSNSANVINSSHVSGNIVPLCEHSKSETTSISRISKQTRKGSASRRNGSNRTSSASSGSRSTKRHGSKKKLSHNK